MSGYTLVAVNDPLEVLSIVKEVNPLVILIDLKMPNKNGFEIIDDLRRLDECRETPIIIMSAFLRPEHETLMRYYGVKRCLSKPFQPLDVIMVIEEALSKRGYPALQNTESLQERLSKLS